MNDKVIKAILKINPEAQVSITNDDINTKNFIKVIKSNLKAGLKTVFNKVSKLIFYIF